MLLRHAEAHLAEEDQRLGLRGGKTAESPAQYRRLMQFIREEGYTAAGFSREITVIDYGFTPDTEKFVTEIMIPLQKV
mgnify:CR=1 FL=1